MSHWNIKDCSRLKRVAITLLALSYLGGAHPAAAQTTIDQLEPFSFGLFSLKDNNSAHELQIDAATNMATNDAAFVVDQPAQRGEYRLSGFTPGTEVTVTIDNGGLTLNGGGGSEIFAVVDYTISPATLIADGSGNIDFYVGATLRTLGNGVTYDSGTYADDLDITFDWIPD